MKLSAADRLIRARTALYIDSPMYGILALRFKLHEDPSIPTLTVSHTTIHYNADFILNLPEELVVSAMAHEVNHVIYDHLNRRGARNPRKWNMAADYVVNAHLKNDGFPIGESWLFNPAFAGMSSDHIYELLPKNDGGNGAGDFGAQGNGPLDDMQPGDPSDAAAESMEWEIAAVQAAAAAKMQGKLPASMERMVEQIKGNKVNWRDRLRRFITAHAKNDYSWARPQRRMLPLGYILPSLHSEAIGLLINTIDTSGSIDQFTLDAFGSEISAMKATVSPERMINIYCDAAINRIDEFAPHEPLKFEMCGGGGTDFRPPFEHIEEQNWKPACFIYLTDGYGTFPKTPPPFPVLWVMTTDVVPPWGEHVKIDL